METDIKMFLSSSTRAISDISGIPVLPILPAFPHMFRFVANKATGKANRPCRRASFPEEIMNH
jgi:hypothetical protein